MSQNVVRRCLRPHLFTRYPYLQGSRSFSCAVRSRRDGPTRDVTRDYEKRVAHLEAHQPRSQLYPRLPERFADRRLAIRDARDRIVMLEPGQTLDEEHGHEPVSVAGRVHSIRTAGSKLVFMDLRDDAHTIQVVVQTGKLETAGVTQDEFTTYARLARKGDWYTVAGYLHKTARGEQSILAVDLPQLVAPSLHQIPAALDDPETRARSRHVDMLVNPELIQTMKLRHAIEDAMHELFRSRGFTKVTTPILTAGAGGAVARPFETEATELEGQKLNLRIAPELWLKRLLVGGMDKVYEIGPAFRNEGVDVTHNPEFSICEFYHAFATLEDLMSMTEILLLDMKKRLDATRRVHFPALPDPNISFAGPYPRLEFVPTLTRELGCAMPDLALPSAQEAIRGIFQQKNIAPPSKPTLPRLLDALASHYLEPLCHAPTFITHHPAGLSPLSKHFTCPQTHQVVAARAELFIRGREYANMYEEENSPFEQRRKFHAQLAYRAVDGEGDGRAEVDDNYLECLEWGLPPTGGWGCGMDRLVMLFGGRERMSDVLAFGSLRNVVALGKRRR